MITREYFIKAKHHHFPNQVFFSYMTIKGDSENAKAIVNYALETVRRDIESEKRVNVDVNNIDIQILSLLQTT